MPEVPLLYPTVEQTGGGAPAPHVDVNEAAFGAQVGGALSHMGANIEADADKLWERAVQFQDLKNRTEADNADTTFMQTAGQLHAKFTALKGTNAEQNFDDYSKQLEQARTDLRSKLSNDMVRKLYDTQSRRTFASTLSNMAGHSGNEAKFAALSAAKANADMHYGMATVAPDERGMLFEMARGDEALRRYNNLAGTMESAEDQIKSAHSDVLSRFSVNLSRNGNDAGAKDFNERHKPEMIHDWDRADQARLTHGIETGAENTADDLVSKAVKDHEFVKNVDEVVEQAKERAQHDFPGDGNAERRYANAAWQGYQREKAAISQLIKESEDTLYGLVLDPNIKNLQGALAHPDGGPAYNNIPNKEKRRFTGIFDTKEDKENWNYLTGLYLSSKDNPYSREQFENMSLAELQRGGKYAVTPQHAMEFVRMRKGMDPRDGIKVNQVINLMKNSPLRSAMQDLNLLRPQDSPDEYNKFVGELSSLLEARGMDKPVTYKDVVDEIGPRIIQTRTHPGTLWGRNTAAELNEPTPEFVDTMQKKAAAKGYPALTDSELLRAYAHKVWKDYYTMQTTTP